jgi:hypothetical protein
MNLTLSINEKTAELARKAAQRMGKSLNQLVRDYLEQVARTADGAERATAFEARCRASQAKLNGWKFNREEANER